jgi:hypothetical protein
MRLARITGLVTRSDLNNKLVNVDNCVDGRYNCFDGDEGFRVKKDNLLFACDRCSAIKDDTAINILCRPDEFMCDACANTFVSSTIDVHNDIIRTADTLFSTRPVKIFHIFHNASSEAINLYEIMVRFLEQIMCGYAEENFFIEPRLFLDHFEEVKTCSEMALQMLSEKEQAQQVYNLRAVASMVRIQHEPIVISCMGREISLEYWGFQATDGSQHHLGGILPLALSHKLNIGMLWCAVFVRHLPAL